MSRILLFGDSWGEGEWGSICTIHNDSIKLCGCKNDPDSQHGEVYAAVHGGLEKYLTDHGCYVNNLSKGSNTNWNAFKDMASHLTNHVRSYSHIFWFVTDPLRQIYQDTTLNTVQDVHDLIEELNREVLEHANRYCHEQDIHFHVIGGLWYFSEQDLEPYDRIHVGCDTMARFFMDPDVWQQRIQKHKYPGGFFIPRNEAFNYTFSEEVVDYFQEQFNSWYSDHVDTGYFPDGAHPDRRVHKKLADYLIDKYDLTPYNTYNIGV